MTCPTCGREMMIDVSPISGRYVYVCLWDDTTIDAPDEDIPPDEDSQEESQ